MATIRLTEKTKEKLESLMLSEIKKELENTETFIKALTIKKYVYTHNDFILKLIKNYEN